MRNQYLFVTWAIVVGAGVASTAAQFDMAAIQKWQAAKVVHYQVTGNYHASTPLAPKAAGYGEVEVTDQVTLEFDWDIRGNATVGVPPRFTNGPSKVIKASSAKTNCPPPTVNGTYEHMEVSAVVPHPSGLELKGMRSYPAAGISSEWPATCKQQSFPAKQENVTEILAVVSPMMLVMPSGANPNLSVANDRKSFTVKVQGWNWTFTPTIVK